MTQISLPDSLEKITDAAFEYCSKLSDVYYKGTEEQWNGINIGDGNRYLTSATIHFNGTGSEELPTEPPTEETPIYEGEITDSGDCGKEGDNVKYELYENGTLRIYGSGDMDNWNSDYYSPWYNSDLIKKIVIEDGVTSIGDYAFSDCESLKEITIPDSVTSIGQSAFSGCKSLTEITIPDSVTRIENGAFSGCKGLTSVTIPSSVSSIGHFLFENCTNLISINVSDNNRNYADMDGVLFNKAKTLLWSYPNGKSMTYTVPDSVTDIEVYAFSSCTDLTEITIPDSVTWIGGYAFDYCTSLTDVYYTGTKEEWSKISISNANDCLKKATIHYNSTGGSIKPPTPTTPATDTEKEKKIKNLHTYLYEYEREMNNYIKTVKGESVKDKKESDKASSTIDGYKKLMESDRKSSNHLLMFTDFMIPEKAREDAYEVLYDFLVKSMDAANQKNVINFEIDKSQSIVEIEASMVQKIYDAVRKGSENPDKGTGKNGYTVDLKICGGIFGIGFGQGTITKGNKTYSVIYCSDKDTVAKVMNLYMNDLCNEVKKQYKDACLSLWRYFLDKSMIQEISKEILKEKLEKDADYLMNKGYGKLVENIILVKETYDEFKDLKSRFSYDAFKKAVEKSSEDDMKLLYKKIQNGSVSSKDVKDKAVSLSMDKLEDARKKAESAVYDYIYGENTVQTGKNRAFGKQFSNVP